MARVPWPTDSSDEWDTLYLGGTVFPGLATVKVTGGQKIDTKDAPGSDGESTTQQGEKAKVVTIALRMWLSEQWEAYDDAHQIVEPVIGKRVPVDIASAAASFRNVGAVLIEDVEGPDWAADKQWMQFTYKCKEHKPPPKKSATKKNDASKASSAGADGTNAGSKPSVDDKSKVLITADEDGYVVYKKVKASAQSGYRRARPGA
jgi:hypothetical protein